MQNLFAVVVWIFTGLLSAVAIILSTGHIQFIILGLIVGICGAGFHVLSKRFDLQSAWWLSAIIIAVLSLLVTMLLIPDTRYWVITKVVLTYYFCFTFILCLLIDVKERFQKNMRVE